MKEEIKKYLDKVEIWKEKKTGNGKNVLKEHNRFGFRDKKHQLMEKFKQNFIKKNQIKL